MRQKPRKFNQKSYDNNDSLAKRLFKDFLLKRGHSITKEDEDYNHDLISDKNNKIFKFELEMKTGYPFTKKETFEFDTVSFLGRKKRLHDIEPFYYVVICTETKWAFCAHSSKIYNPEYYETVWVDSRDREGLDGMYRVPKDLCMFFKVK